LSVQPPATFKEPERSKAFYFASSTFAPAPLDDNNILFDSRGNLKTPGTVTTVLTPNNPQYGRQFTFAVNYDAILYWLKNTGPNPFPSQLRSGGVLYYSSIPDHIDTQHWPPQGSGSTTDLDQRFWKEYIDEVLGYQQYNNPSNFNGTYIGAYQIITPETGYGADFTFLQTLIRQKPIVGSGLMPPTTPPYMDYRDNPRRGLTHWWFGPMTMLDFLGNFNVQADYSSGSTNRTRLWWPGTCHEAPCWQAKIGISGALQDMQNNHPNDLATLILFSVPNSPTTPVVNGGPVSGNYNVVPVPLGNNYNTLKDALWFPPEVIQSKSEIRIWNTSNNDNVSQAMLDVPRAVGGTCYAMPLMLAYNQFNVDPSQRSLGTITGQVGGLGRRGAQKTIIFETDGMVAATAYSSFSKVFSKDSGNRPGYSYFAVRQPSGEYPDYVVGDTTLAPQEAKDVAQAICNMETDPSTPGYGTTRKKVFVHTIAFGSLFDPSNSSSYKTNALNLLQSLQAIGYTQEAPGQPNDATTALPSYKVITGSAQTRIDNLQTAFTKILQDGLQLALIK
jgi:hypothetical protein